MTSSIQVDQWIFVGCWFTFEYFSNGCTIIADPGAGIASFGGVTSWDTCINDCPMNGIGNVIDWRGT